MTDLEVGQIVTTARDTSLSHQIRARLCVKSTLIEKVNATREAAYKFADGLKRDVIAHG